MYMDSCGFGASVIYTCIQEGSQVLRTFPGLKYRMISGGGIVAPYSDLSVDPQRNFPQSCKLYVG